MSTDIELLKRDIRDIKRTLEQHGMRLEDLERAGSPDGVVDAATQRDEMQEVAARICQQVERERGGFQSDMIGA